MPRQVPPVKRPELVQPHETVDVVHGRPIDLIRIRVDLTHGANYNDPGYFQVPSYSDAKNR